ncbi:MAG: glycosyltransferase [Erythrobacter sp.]|nr:glycosyltransferase [Erythrobacter sp.]
MNNSVQSAPILIFAYNRPDKLEGLLRSLAACPELESSEISIYVDGPRDDSQLERVAVVKGVAESMAPGHARIFTRTENFGLKRSIVTGVTDALERYESVIVLEDDLVVSPQLLTYFNSALTAYADNDRVSSLTGYMFNVPTLAKRDTSFFLPFPNPWGWATWRSRWNSFIANKDQNAVELKSCQFRQSFNAYGVRDFASILELDRAGLVNSWFINWYFSIFKQSGLTLWPPQPLVENQGVGGGTHASSFNLHRFLPRPLLSEEFLPKLPDLVSIDYAALDLIANSTDVKIQKLVSQVGGLRRRIAAHLRDAP